MRGVCAAAVLAVVGAAACDGREETAPRAALSAPATVAPSPAVPTAQRPLEGFSHVPGVDLFGYYMSDGVQAGSLRLTHLHMGSEDEFRPWEAGTRTATYAPVMLVFEDLASPEVETEIGPVREVEVRVLPSAYAIGERVRFAGRDARLGEVTFVGTLDLKALAAAREAGNSGAPPVLKGDLRIGQRTWPGVAFTWFGGD